MIGRRQLLGLLGASGLLAVPKTAAAQPRTARPFNGLTTGVGDLYRLSRAKTRSISPENFTGEKGRGAMADRGHRRTGRSRSRRRLEDLAVGAHRTGADIHARRHQGAGRHPAHLDDANRPLAALHSAHLLGRRDVAVGRDARGRLLRVRLGQVRADQLGRRGGESRQRVQLLLGDAVPALVPDDAREHRGTAHDGLLPDRSHADRHPRRCRVPPRAVPPRQPAAVQAGLHHRGRHQGRRATTSARTCHGA